MLVKELIEKLKEFPPDTRVLYMDRYNGPLPVVFNMSTTREMYPYLDDEGNLLYYDYSDGREGCEKAIFIDE